MKKQLLGLFAVSVVCSCAIRGKSENYISDDDGIIVERADKAKNFDQNYNDNNRIYSIGKTFTYTYSYIAKNGKPYLITKGKEIQKDDYKEYDWEFIEPEKQNNETIKSIVLKPIKGNPFSNDLPDYNQTGISYAFIQNNGKPFTMEVTGAVENEKNVWIHPPRSSFFRVLELNPFPYIKAPYKIGNSWNWKLDIGEHWADKRWLEWKGEIANSYGYKIIKKEKIKTKLGELACYVVESTAKSRIGNTELRSYFNEKFGFVKLVYKNIDGSKTILELEKVE